MITVFKLSLLMVTIKINEENVQLQIWSFECQEIVAYEKKKQNLKGNKIIKDIACFK